MADATKTTTHLPLLLLAAGAVAGFWFHGSAAGSADSSAPAAAPAPTVMPIVVSMPTPGYAAPAPVVQVLPTVRQVIPGGTRVVTAGAPSATTVSAPSTVSSVSTGSYASSTVIQDYSVSVVGDRVVVASDGSIVQVGDHGNLHANTGDSSGGGSIGVDVSDSTLVPGTPAPTSTAPTASTINPSANRTGRVYLPTTAPTTSPRRNPSATGAPLSGQLMVSPSGATSIAGYENHSIDIGGDDNLVSYDDSNVFIDRNGRINANTGDTDSSGLNAVDVSGSVVRSGNSGDGEGTGQDGDDAGDDEDATDLGSDDDVRTAPLAPRTTGATGASATVGDDDGTTSASGTNPLVIGGDGYDDLGVRLFGNRNIVTYDDGNIVIGGTGDVNAQVGDSDTGGAVVMGVRGSLVEAGCEGDLCPQYLGSGATVGTAPLPAR